MLNETQYWSVGIGTWRGVPLHVHLSLVVTTILLIGAQAGLAPGLVDPSIIPTGSVLGSAMLTVALMALVILTPMWIQMTGVQSPTNAIRRICLSPGGTNFEWQVDTTPQHRRRTHVTGILANAILLAIALVVYGASQTTDGNRFWISVYPLYPQLPSAVDFVSSLLASFVWMNAATLFLRMIPIVPFDLGRVLVDWAQIDLPQFQPIQRSSILFLVGVFYVFLSVSVAYLFVPEIDGQVYSLGVWPLIGGLCLLFVARRDYLREVYCFYNAKLHPASAEEIDYPDYDDELESDATPSRRSASARSESEFVDSGDSSVNEWDSDDSHDSSWEVWMDETRASRRKAREDQAAAEIALLDGILLKVSTQGIAALTPNEREILDRVSQIYRRRRKLRQ